MAVSRRAWTCLCAAVNAPTATALPSPSRRRPRCSRCFSPDRQTEAQEALMAIAPDLDSRVRSLLDAEASRSEIGRIDPEGALSEDEAYRLQFLGIDWKVAQGDSVAGLKTGLTSKAKQATMGVHQPIFGHLMASSIVPEGVPV